MRKPLWLSVDLVLALHERLLSEFGGLPGVRDQGLLESALARPRNLISLAKPTLFDLAAAYAFGIVQNHPFTDGNKRVGFTSAVIFLETNGYDFAASEADATVSTLALAARDMEEAGYAAWLKKNSKRSPAR